MKKLICLLSLSIFFISLASACVDSGFDWCYSNSIDKYDPAHCYVEIQGTLPKCDGTQHGSYCVGNWYVDVKHEGDKFYIRKQTTSWSQLSCGKSGCSGGQEISDGRVYLTIGVGKVPKYILGAWDGDEQEGAWCWTEKKAGYIGEFFNQYAIACYDETDCGYGKHCDKSGGVDNWKCVINICENEGERCVGTNLYKCEEYQWADKGNNRGECGFCISPADCDNAPENQKGKFTCEQGACAWHQTWYSTLTNWVKNFFSKWRLW